jgi:tetratricopeptide (TPR) repeat protein
LYEEENYDEALPLITDLIQQSDTLQTPATYFVCGQILHKKELFEDAIEMFSRCIELDPLNADAYLARGESYIQVEEFEVAAHELEKFLKIEEPTIDCLVSLAKCKASVDELDTALEYFTSAIELNSENGNAQDPYLYFLRGDMYLRMGLDQEASNDFKKLLEVDPNFISSYEQNAIDCM